MPATNHKAIFEDFVGIDISKDILDCWIRPKATYSQWCNGDDGFERLHQWLISLECNPSKTLIVMENTGIYGDRLLSALTKRGWKCAMVKTTATERVAPEHHRKDDRFDAQLLAEYGDRYSDRITLTDPPEQAIDQLQRFFSERKRLINAQTATLNRRQQADHSLGSSELLHKNWEQQLEVYAQQIKQLEAHIHQLIVEHPGLNAYYQLLLTIPGVGQVTAWLWLILFYGKDRLNHKQIASRFGFAPHRHVSGSSVRGQTRSSGHGNTQMRACMTMVARSVSHHYDRFARYKQRKLEEGKPWPVIRNNLINKMIKIICAIWNSGEIYQQNHESRFDRQKNVA